MLSAAAAVELPNPGVWKAERLALVCWRRRRRRRRRR